jgi:hypothetical protein
MKVVKFVLVLILMGLSFVLGTKFSEMKENSNNNDIFTKDNTEIVKDGAVEEITIVSPAEGDNLNQEMALPAENIDINIEDAISLDIEVEKVENNAEEQQSTTPQEGDAVNGISAPQNPEIVEDKPQDINTLPATF